MWMRKRKRRVLERGVRGGQVSARIVSRQLSSARSTRRPRYSYGSRPEMGFGPRAKRPYSLLEKVPRGNSSSRSSDRDPDHSGTEAPAQTRCNLRFTTPHVHIRLKLALYVQLVQDKTKPEFKRFVFHRRIVPRDGAFPICSDDDIAFGFQRLTPVGWTRRGVQILEVPSVRQSIGEFTRC